MSVVSGLSRGLILIVVVSFLSTSTAWADQIDNYIRQAMQKRRIPGLALAVVKDGKVVKAKGYGIANLETGTPVTPQTVFELASITKQFTAAGIMLLVEQGKVGLDQPINAYIDGAPDSWKNITVRHLLTHTAGFPPNGQNFKSLVWTLDVGTQEMFDAARKDTLGFQPGDKHEYSDVGYFLLGMIIEKASAQDYRTFLAERIFKPAGMTSSSVLDQYHVIRNRARGYTLYENELLNIRRDVALELPSALGVMSTVLDLAKWDAALRSNKVLTQSSLKQMWTAVRLNNGGTRPYGFGWGLDAQRGHNMVGHSGMTGTEIVRFVNDGLTVIVLTNLGSVGNDTPGAGAWGLAKRVAEFYIPSLAYRPIADHDPQVTALVKGFFSEPFQPWDSKLFRPEIAAALSDSEKSSQEYVKALGSLRSVALVERRQEDGVQTFRYRLTYTRSTLMVSLNIDDTGRIGTLLYSDDGPE